MKCPLFTANKMTDTGCWEETPRDCLKEECAQWDDFDKRCEFKSIRVALTQIEETLEIICKKMPHVEQFKRA